MNLLAALILLLSCSDTFDALDPLWQISSQGPDLQYHVENGQMLLTSNSRGDLVREFARPVDWTEKPVAVFQVTFPQSTDGRLGCRMTILRDSLVPILPGIFVAMTSPLWPGFFVNADNTLTIRNLEDYPLGFPLPAGEHALSVAVSENRALQFYFDDILVCQDNTGWVVVQSFDGWFLQTNSPTGKSVDGVELYADIRPALNISRNGDSLTLDVSGYPGEPYPIQKSLDLLSWEPFNGSSDMISQPSQFYRLRVASSFLP